MKTFRNIPEIKLVYETAFLKLELNQNDYCISKLIIKIFNKIVQKY